MVYKFVISIGLALFIASPAYAQEPEREDLRAKCIDALGFSDELANTGTYRLRVDDCVQDAVKAEQDGSRLNRLLLRAKNVQDRINRNSRIVIQRVIPEPETDVERFDRFQRLYNAESTYRRLQRNRPSRRTAIQRIQDGEAGYTPFRPEITKPKVEYRIRSTRPSRRLIKQDAYDQTRESRIESADEYQNDLNNALEKCSHLKSTFHRNNCVNSELRRIGSQ